VPAAAAHPPAARAVRIPLDGAVTAAHAALVVHGDERPFALTGRWAGAAALVGSEPVRVARDDEDPFALLDEQPAVDGAPAGFVGGGWFGMLGYDLGRRIESLSPPPPAPEQLPGAVLAFHDHVLRLDGEGRWWFEALWTDERSRALEARLAVLRERVATGVGEPPAGVAVAPGPWWATPSPAGHARAVAACRERIAAGDLFQANLSLRLRAALESDSVDLFTRGVAALAPDRAAWLSGPWGAVASLSPELFVERRGDAVRSAPIKGTRPRPADAVAAEAQRVELAAAPKDRAENVMIVDLMRNDLGRVCEPGSVRVTALAEVRPHAGVWHLVSEVAGRLRPGIGDGALVSALFPPGSVTGAPKVAAMDVISELESTARQAFCGAFGFASPAAGLELSVAIRTFECRDGAVWLDVGGGVVADSDPDGEAAECLAKARPLLAAIGATLEVDGGAVDGAGGPRADAAVEPRPDAAAGPGPAAPAERASGGLSAPIPRRLGVHPVPRPDPAAGIFETLLVRDGVAIAAEEHLERLARSAQELYAVALPVALPAVVQHAALEQGGPCRIRVVLGWSARHAGDDRPAGRPRRAQVARPAAGRCVGRGGGAGDPAARRPRRPRPGDDPRERLGDARRRAGHAAARRPHPPRRHPRDRPERGHRARHPDRRAPADPRRATDRRRRPDLRRPSRARARHGPRLHAPRPARRAPRAADRGPQAHAVPQSSRTRPSPPRLTAPRRAGARRR
jgi:para-aminobenzoate synthetase/4-amino-4-deoxychorismate lyase